MNIIQTNIPSVLIIKPRVFKAPRGYFFESFSQRKFDEPKSKARAESSVPELCLASRRKTEGQKVLPLLGHSICGSSRKKSLKGNLHLCTSDIKAW